MSKIVVKVPAKLFSGKTEFDANKFEMYMSTHGVLIIRVKDTCQIVKAFASGQWETAEVV